MAEFFCVCKWLAHLRCAMGRHRVAIAAARQFGCNRRKNGLASVGLGGATIGADLSDNRAALPLRARGVLRQGLRRSEFARSWRKFRVRGPLHKGGLAEGEGAFPPSSDSWKGPLTPTLSRQAGEGAVAAE